MVCKNCIPHIKPLNKKLAPCCLHEKLVRQDSRCRAICDLCDQTINDQPAFNCDACVNSGSSGFDVCLNCAKTHGLDETTTTEIKKEDLRLMYMKIHSSLE